MKLKCPNKKCGYEWNYIGRGGKKKRLFATCPRCLYKVKIKEVKDGRREE